MYTSEEEMRMVTDQRAAPRQLERSDTEPAADFETSKERSSSHEQEQFAVGQES